MDERLEVVNICGIPYRIKYVDDHFCKDLHLGEIEYGKAEIRINKNIDKNILVETLCHEVVHGILVHIGRQDLSDDETLVQALGNAINQTFALKVNKDESNA